MPEDHEYGGPYLAMAIFCEKVLTDKDGVLSAIRIVDRFMITASGGAPPDRMPATTLNLSAVLSFKSGFFKGSAEIRLMGRKPSGPPFATTTLPILLEGDDRGANAVLEMSLQVTEDGLYWFDVLLGDRLLTRMPLRVVYQRIASGPGQTRAES